MKLSTCLISELDGPMNKRSIPFRCLVDDRGVLVGWIFFSADFLATGLLVSSLLSSFGIFDASLVAGEEIEWIF